MYMRIVILLIENMYIDLSLSLCYNYSATFFKHLLLIKISYNEIILTDEKDMLCKKRIPLFRHTFRLFSICVFKKCSSLKQGYVFWCVSAVKQSALFLFQEDNIM